MKRLALYLLLIMFVSQSLGADIMITKPEKPIRIGRLVKLYVTGLTDAELSGSVVNVTPPEGVDSSDIDLDLGKSWQNEPYIGFSSEKPGKYLIQVDVNAFRQDLDRGLVATTKANIDGQLLNELRVTVTKINGKYPLKAGSTVVEVAGSIVPPPPPPPPPPIPTEGVAEQLIILRDQTSITTKQVAVLLDLQEKYQEGSKPEMYLIDKTSPAATPYLGLKSTTEGFPYYFLIDKGGNILSKGKMSDTLKDTLDVIEKYKGDK